ncbi:type II toxin-antitoxin system YafQ family toxin [Polynucleobacter sp. 31A-FELB]|uniref:type II toxin-antitoxin system YafQ family toxin n=1 Tax=Polynucleobacter sp. 31A-FELB TaxID=2689096 RepID=UPI001C0B8405|nr:type II toxin-antitoxin system YafQ family toxin [Polynucleobacter sp. 31A-FELB]MBU3587818.1 type II toxin-antitoxin system YafQ family toxin [Polynucleobacter sp. 31A-FELB]
MRTIEISTAFKRDLKRESKGLHKTNLSADLRVLLDSLVNDLPLEPHYRDHDLTGNWLGYRECHIKPDLLLIYRLADKDTLRLARLGSHSQLFG